MAQIFISHSKHDADIKRFFGDLFGRSNVKALSVEYEKYHPPAWRYIQPQIAKSAAVFVLLGPNVQQLAHTQVWIGSETGGVPQGKEVWVFEHTQYPCDIPIPNVHHYMIYDYGEECQNYIRAIIESYDDSATLPSLVAGGAGGAAIGGPLGAIVGALLVTSATSPARNRPLGVIVTCPNQQCLYSFHLHTRVNRFPCPVCRNQMQVRWD